MASRRQEESGTSAVRRELPGQPAGTGHHEGVNGTVALYRRGGAIDRGPRVSAAIYFAAMVLSVIVACLNEEACVPALIDRLTAVLGQEPIFAREGTELVFVDDGSTDKTWMILEQAALADTRVTLERHEHNQGLASAWRTGLARARGQFISTLDADLQYRPEDIVRLYRAVHDREADLAQGVRSDRYEPGPRRILSRGLSWILNVAFGMRLADNQSGFVLCPREGFSDLLSYRRHYADWPNLVLFAV